MDAAFSEMLARIEETALDCGFSRTGRFDAAAVKARREVRDACAADKCRSYGKNWSCPPACGSLEECEKQIRQFRQGVMLQTTGGLEDSFDYESILVIGKEHNARLKIFREKLEQVLPPRQPRLLLGAGGCTNCEKCTCPRSPCVSPESMIIPMEAMGIVVSELCKTCGIPYYYGPNALTYAGCLIL